MGQCHSPQGWTVIDVPTVQIVLTTAMTDFQDAFISYGRADSRHFAAHIYTRLREQGFKIWFDQNDIPLGVDFQTQIDDGIATSHNFLFIIAPHSVNSPYCAKEIALALRYQKRIIPLLHVEQISYDTWHARNPTGTLEQWQEYQAQGLHSSFPNMHPAIGKINWVYFREGIDDFEQSVQGLLEVLHRHQGYVQHHTLVLNQALQWSRNQKQPRYLLTGRDRLQAENWLRVRFMAEQPPCEPTDLHCEFICESIKNANNLMTQVFLCYDDADRAAMEQIRASLMREGFTVWTDTMDIRTGEDTRVMGDRGIEGADAVVFLASQFSLQSPSCQHELDHAWSLNKRVIPLQVGAIAAAVQTSRRNRRGLDSIYAKLDGDEADSPTTDLGALPPRLRSLQFIDFLQIEDSQQYRDSLDKLIATLHSHASYYELHKILLTRALKWQAQHQNLSILLRGYRLEQAQAWLREQAQHEDHPPTDLQRAYIQASLDHPPEASLDVFISYPMEESDFARRLNDALQLQGKTTWFDQDNVGSRIEDAATVLHGLETCDNVLVLIAPYTLDLPNHKQEVDHALQLNKRVILVLPYGLTGDCPNELRGLPTVDFSDDGGRFAANFSELIRLLEVDRDYVHSHTHWLQRAIAWDEKDKNPDLLLRGSELAIAQTWLREADATQKTPPVVPLQRQFINASQQLADELAAEEQRQQVAMLKLQEERTQEAEARLAAEHKSFKRQRLLLQVVTVGLLAALGVVGFALSQYRNALLRQVEATTLSSRAKVNDNNHLDALVLILEAQKITNWVSPQPHELTTIPPVDVVLRQIIYGIQEYNRVAHPSSLELDQVAFSPDGQHMVTVDGRGMLWVWTGYGQRASEAPFAVVEDHATVVEVEFHPDGHSVWVASSDGQLIQWGLDGSQRQVIQAHAGGVVAMAISADRRLLVSVGQDQTLKRWTIDGQWINTMALPDLAVAQVGMTPGENWVVTADRNNVLTAWSLAGEPLHQIQLPNPNDPIYSLAIHPGGGIVAVGRDSGDIDLWTMATDRIETIEDAHVNEVDALLFADGDTLVSGGRDRRIHLWSIQGVLRETFHGHSHRVADLAAAHGMIASVSADGTLRLWRRNTRRRVIEAHPNWEVLSHAMHPSGAWVATAGSDQVVRLWQSDGRAVQDVAWYRDEVSAVAFSPTGDRLATADERGLIALWQVPQDATEALSLDAPERDMRIGTAQISILRFNAAGDRLLALDSDGQIYVLDLTGQLLQQWSAPDDGATVVGMDRHPQTDWIAAVSEQALYLWDPEGIVHTPSLSLPQGETVKLRGVVFGPTGQSLATLGYQEGSDANSANPANPWRHRVDLWQIDAEGNLTHRHTLNGSGHSTWLVNAAFSPDGRYLASSSDDGMVKVWDGETGRLLTTLDGHRAGVHGLTFDPESERLWSSGLDGRLMIWNLGEIFRIQEEVNFACTWVQNYLQHPQRRVAADPSLCRQLQNRDRPSVLDALSANSRISAP
jgi:WD40 repeat protein